MLQSEKREKDWDKYWHLVRVTELLFCAWRARLPCKGGLAERQGANWAGFMTSCGLPEPFPLSVPIHRAHSGFFLHNSPRSHLACLWRQGRPVEFHNLAKWLRTPEAAVSSSLKVVNFPFFLSLTHFLFSFLCIYYYFLLYSIFFPSSGTVVKFLIRKYGPIRKLII